MICRMNLSQREAIIKLIEVSIAKKIRHPDYWYDAYRQAVEDFHTAFKNDSDSEDQHRHA